MSAHPVKKPAVRRPGRPKGASTRSETPAMKRAREFFDYLYANNSSKLKAARHVAARWQVQESTVLKDAHRHKPRLLRTASNKAICNMLDIFLDALRMDTSLTGNKKEK